MTIKLILNITLTIIIIYIFFIYNVENLEDTPETNKQITDAVKRIYLADVEAIRNLGAIAGKLNTGDKLDFPGQLNIKTTLATNGLDPTILPPLWTGGIRFIDGYSSGIMGFGPDGRQVKARIDKEGNIEGNNLKLLGNITLTNGNINGNITLTNGSIGFGTGTALNAQIKENGDINGNNLILTGDINGNNLILTGDINGNKLTSSNITSTNLISGNITSTNLISGNITSTNLISDNIISKGNITSTNLISQGNITGINLIADNILTKRNKARYIRVGNKMTPSTEIKNLDGSTNTDVSPLAIDYWTLIKIIVISRGVNIVQDKTPTPIGPESDNKPYTGFTKESYKNITKGNIFNIPAKPDDNYKLGYHGNTGRHLLEIDLVNEYDIDAIELYSRYESSSSNRLNGTIIELISGDKNKPETLIINRRIHTGIWTTTYSKEYILN